MPSVSSEASASASACAQSIPPSGPSAVRRRSSCRSSLGWTVNPSGQVSSCSLSAVRNSGDSAVSNSCPAPLSRSACSLVMRLAHAGLEGLLDVHQALIGLARLPVGFFRGEHAGGHQLLRVHVPHGRVALDPLVHQRLGVGRLVALVVAVAAVADQIDQRVLMELVAVRHRQPHRAEARLGVVGVDVDDRNVESLGQVGRRSGCSARPPCRW